MSEDCPQVGHDIPRRLEVEAASGSLRGIDHSGMPIFAIMHNIPPLISAFEYRRRGLR